MKLLTAAILIVLFAVFAVDTKGREASCVMPAASAEVQGIRVARRLGETINHLATAPPPAGESVKTAVDRVERMLLRWFKAFIFGTHGEPSPPDILRVERKDDERRRNAELCSDVADLPGQDEPPNCTPPQGPPVDMLVALQQDRFTPEQKTIAQTAIRVGQEKGIPEQGWVVILAAGGQESQWRNLSYGDRDSLGWLQQRASWGTVQQRMNPAYAAGKFYDRLVKISGWEKLPVTRAAQAVQVSAFPDAYAKWEDDARALVAALGPCQPAVDPGGKQYNLGPVQPQTSRVAHLLGHMFKVDHIGGHRQDALPDHPSGLAIDLMVYRDSAKGQRIADYARSHATTLGVEYIIWNQRIWSVARDDEGWRLMADRGGVSANHLDHVHITMKGETV